MGLRQKKQSRQRSVILENAVALFRERGIGAVRIADITVSCEISEATFFNYFGSRDMLLREWASDVLDEELAGAVARMESGGLLRREIRQSLKELAARVQLELHLHKEAWSRLVAAHPDPMLLGARGRTHRTDPALALMALAQDQHECRGDLPAEQLAMLLRAVLTATVASGLAHVETEPANFLEHRLVNACDLLLDGFRKRNERIKPERETA